MKSTMFVASVCGLILICGRAPGSFFDISPALPERVVQAKSIIVVKVLRIEKDTVTIKSAPNFNQDYKVAVVKVESSLKGGKESSEMRVGFTAPAPKQKLPPGLDNLPGPPQLEKGQEALLLLTPLEDSDLEVVSFRRDLVDKKTKTFEKDLKFVEQCLKLLEKPEDGLKATDAADRFLTARLLIDKYRPNSGFGFGVPKKNKEVPIDAEESKLILKALAEGDWKPKTPAAGGANELSAYDLFLTLQVSKDDGFIMPKDPSKVADAAKAWVKDNMGKYRIKKFVEEEKKEGGKKK
jgi:hypothetical protein